VPEEKSRRRRELEVETKRFDGLGNKGRYRISKVTGSVKVSFTSVF